MQQPVASAATPSAPAAPAAPVDVGAVLAAMAQQNGQPLNYKTSIVDLLKLLSLDSSMDARKTLAGELHYTGSTEDSAAMNMWLHKEVMAKLEQNGGVVPAGAEGRLMARVAPVIGRRGLVAAAACLPLRGPRGGAGTRGGSASPRWTAACWRSRRCAAGCCW